MPPIDTEITTARGAAWPIPAADASAESATGFEKVSEQMNDQMNDQMNQTQNQLKFDRAANGAQLGGEVTMWSLGG